MHTQYVDGGGDPVPAPGQLRLAEHEGPILEARCPRRAVDRDAIDLDALVLQVVPVQVAQGGRIGLADEVVIARHAHDDVGGHLGEPVGEGRVEPLPLRLRALVSRRADVAGDQQEIARFHRRQVAVQIGNADEPHL